MTAPHRFTGRDPQRGERRVRRAPAGEGSGRAARALLWTGVGIGGAGNAVTSLGGYPLISPVFGVVTVLCAVMLVVHHLKRRR
ncbi:hypothetical protein [Salinactinospora qingdaonensis]|uniref:DUF1275 domain-containing protein n=1 Tax=Salinactinospora qingdaonensis TaxID=702744 RepID=A0ABP7G4A1_9ACTN